VLENDLTRQVKNVASELLQISITSKQAGKFGKFGNTIKDDDVFTSPDQQIRQMEQAINFVFSKIQARLTSLEDRVTALEP
jgi:hypothetical protein